MDEKKRLKAARQLVDAKKYDDALAACEKLANEAESVEVVYMALIFKGLCLSETSNSKRGKDTYLHATTVMPDKPTAWQALYKLYESGKLSTVDTDYIRCIDALRNGCFIKDDAAIARMNEQKLIALVQLKLYDDACNDLCASKESDIVSLKIFKLISTRDSDAFHLAKTCYGMLPVSTKTSELEAKMLEMEYLNSDYTSWFSLASNIILSGTAVSLSSVELFALGQTIAILMGNNPVEIDSDGPALPDSDVMSIVDEFVTIALSNSPSSLNSIVVKLAKLPEESSWNRCTLLLMKADLARRLRRYREAITVFEAVLQNCDVVQRDASVKMAIKARIVQCKLGFSNEAAESTETMTELAEILDEQNAVTLSDTLKDELRYNFIYMCSSENCQLAWNALTKLSDQSSALYLGCLAWLQLRERNYEEAKKNAVRAIQINPDNGRLYLTLAKALWDSGVKSAATLGQFLKAAKADPTLAEPFLYMGLYYRQDSTLDLQKALRCLERAYSLQDNSTEICRELSDTFEQLEALSDADTAAVAERHLSFLKMALNSLNSLESEWVRMKLAVKLSAADHCNESIEILQALAVVKPTDRNVWECLGDAYLSRGAFESARKCFAKYPASAYSVFKTATIDLETGEFESAVDGCDRVLVGSDDTDDAEGLTAIETIYAPLLSTKCHARVSLARRYADERRFVRAKVSVQLAFEDAIALLKRQPIYATSWKLLGDVASTALMFDNNLFVMSTSLENDLEDLHLNAASLGPSSSTRQRLSSLAIECYSKAISRQHSAVSLWYDLGLAYFHSGYNGDATDVSSQSTEDDVNASTSAFRKAVVCLQKCLSLCGVEDTVIIADCWTALGIVHSVGMHRNDLAQHCYVKALQANSEHCAAWTCLGVLYLGRGEVQLAHAALSSAQNAEADSPQAWSAMALVAEQAGNKTEAADLHRHTTQLMLIKPSAEAYAFHLLDSARRNKMPSDDAVVSCIDALQNLSVLHGSAEIAVLLALLLELQRDYGTACSVIQKLRESEIHGSYEVENEARFLGKCGKFAPMHSLVKTPPTSFDAKFMLSFLSSTCQQFQFVISNYSDCFYSALQKSDEIATTLLYSLALAATGKLPETGSDTLLEGLIHVVSEVRRNSKDLTATVRLLREIPKHSLEDEAQMHRLVDIFAFILTSISSAAAVSSSLRLTCMRLLRLFPWRPSVRLLATKYCNWSFSADNMDPFPLWMQKAAYSTLVEVAANDKIRYRYAQKLLHEYRHTIDSSHVAHLLQVCSLLH